MPEPERDPFGNPIAAGTATVPPSAAAPPDPPPDAPAAVAPALGDRPRRPGRLLRRLFLLACLAATGFVLWEADQAAQDSPSAIARDIEGRALAAASLVRDGNLRRALRAARAEMEPGEQALMLRLTPEELLLRVRDGNGNARMIGVDVAFEARSSDSGTDTTSAPLALDAVDAEAAQRIVRQALRQAGGADDTHLEYAVLSGNEGSAPTWYVALRDVRIGDQTWTADLDGIAVTRPGELPAASGVAGASLLAPANLRLALTSAARSGGRVSHLRLAPERLDVTVVGGRGALTDVFVDAAQRVTTREGAGSATTTLALRRIDVQGPRRAVVRAARRGGFSPAHLDYGVLSIPTPGFGAQPEWVLFFDGVPQRRAQWRASADGREVRPL